MFETFLLSITAIATTAGAILAGRESWIRYKSQADVLSVKCRSIYHQKGNDFLHLTLELTSKRSVYVRSISSKNFWLNESLDQERSKKVELGITVDDPKDPTVLAVYVSPLPKTGQALDIAFDIGLRYCLKECEVRRSSQRGFRGADHGEWSFR